MKNKAKAIYRIFTVMLVLALSFAAVSAFAANDPLIYGGDVTGKPGETVTLPIYIANNPGIAGIALEFTYDTSLVTLSTMTDCGDFNTDRWIFDTNECKLIWANDTMISNGVRIPVNNTANGLFFNLTFDIKSTAKTGIVPVSIAPVNNETGNISDKDAKAVAFKTEAGVIRIVEEGQTKYLTNVTLKQPADKLSYWVNDKFDITGAKLLLEYNDESSETIDVTEGMLESVPTLSKAQKYVIQVVYDGWEKINDLTFDIDVKKPGIVKIELTKEPAKKVYNQGDRFTSEGGVIRVTYENGTTADVNVTNNMCSGYDMSKDGVQTVTVTYEQFTAQYKITVNKNASPTPVKPTPTKPAEPTPVPPTPPTDDTSSLPLICMAVIASMAVIVYLTVKNKKEEND